MNVSRLLMAAVFASACSGDPEPTRARPEPAPEPRTAPAPGPEATTGEKTPPPKGTPPAPRVDAATKDERDAARGPVTAAAAEAGVNRNAAILQDFKARVGAYLGLHEQAATGEATLKESDDPDEILAAQAVLAARIRASRADARQGDIFSTEIRHTFRQLLAPELEGSEGRDAKAILKDDAPAPANVPFTVNATYPEGQPLPTVPANVLLNLPTLPEGLEYRIIGKHLVLLDMKANLIVDYIPNAIV
jgi:hypothetical protein